jgi:Spy/CpxP family protein refolding chaperone
MKTSRLFSFTLGALLLASLPALRAADENHPDGPPPGARGERGGPGGPGGRAGDRIAEELGLSADQKAKWKAIGEQERAEMQAIRADTSLAKEDRMAKGKAIHEKYKAERDAVLTAEQKAKAEQLRGKMKDRMEKRQEGRQERREKKGD